VEAFSDAVIAIIITIMVLELKVPHGADLEALRPLVPKLLSYVLSFAYLGIYWNNHHHLFQAVHRVTGAVLWTNLLLLFWLSLIPFVTAWMGESAGAPLPVAFYGGVLILCAVAWVFLARALLAAHPKDAPLAKAIGRDAKEKASLAIYAAAIPLSFVEPVVSWSLYALAALMWVIPDRRIERELAR
jgi:uncharacterized membrane protein